MITGHSKQWFERSGIDYYMSFVRTWIAFNSWYMHHFTLNDESDRAYINEIKNTDNQFRNRIMTLLKASNEDEESKCFKKNLGLLHEELEKRAIPKYDTRVTFTNIDIGISSNTVINEAFDGMTYKVERYTSGSTRPNKQVDCVIINSKGQTKLIITQAKYNLFEFMNHSDYLKHNSENQKKKLLEFYRKINPRKVVNLVYDNTSKKNDYIELTERTKFKNNIDDIAVGLIEIIYSLRCKIFHGELEPSWNNMKIYEYAFNILSLLLKQTY